MRSALLPIIAFVSLTALSAWAEPIFIYQSRPPSISDSPIWDSPLQADHDETSVQTPDRLLRQTPGIHVQSQGSQGSLTLAVPPTSVSSSKLLVYFEDFPIFDPSGFGFPLEWVPLPPGTQTTFQPAFFPQFETRPFHLGGNLQFKFPESLEDAQIQVRANNHVALEVEGSFEDLGRVNSWRLHSRNSKLPYTHPKTRDSQKLPKSQTQYLSVLSKGFDSKGSDLFIFSGSHSESLGSIYDDPTEVESEDRSIFVFGGRNLLVGTDQDVQISLSGRHFKSQSPDLQQTYSSQSLASYLRWRLQPEENRHSMSVDHRYEGFESDDLSWKGKNTLGIAIDSTHSNNKGFARLEGELPTKKLAPSAGWIFFTPFSENGVWTWVSSLASLHQFPSVPALYGSQNEFFTILPNRNLGTERTHVISTGFDAQTSSFQWSLLGFASKSPDLHQVELIDSQTSKTENIENAAIQGAVHHLNWEPVADWQINQHATWIGKAKDRNREPIPYKPTWTVNHRLSWNVSDQWEASTSHQYTSHRRTHGQDKLTHFHLIDLQASYSPNPSTRVTVAIENLLEEASEVTPGYPLIGRTLWLGLQKTY